MSFCLHHSKLFTRRTKFAQLPCFNKILATSQKKA